MSDKKTLSQIIEAVKAGEHVTEDQLRCGLLAMESLWTFMNMDLRKHASGQTRRPLMKTYEECFRRNKTALNTDPRTWLGSSVPENPDYQAFRGLANKLVDRFFGEAEDE